MLSTYPYFLPLYIGMLFTHLYVFWFSLILYFVANFCLLFKLMHFATAFFLLI